MYVTAWRLPCNRLENDIAGACSADSAASAASLGGLSHLTSLTSLDLTYALNMCDEVIWHLTTLVELAELKLARNRGLTDAALPGLWCLTALTSLNLSNTCFAGLPGAFIITLHLQSSSSL